ncbi:MAG: glycosyltransferase, partial [Candidatus Kapaibacterium sp.]
MGGQKSLLALIDNLDRTRFKPYLTMPLDGELKNLAEERGIEVFIKPVPPMNLMSFFKLIKLRNEYVKFIKKNQIKLIHTDDDKFAYFSTFIARKAGIKSIYHARVAQIHKYDKILEPRIDQIIGISDATIFRFKESTINSKFIKIFDGLDCQLFHSDYNQSELKKKLEINENSTTLLFVGQLLVTKGLDDILDAMNILSENSKKEFKLYIIGTEPRDG